MVAQERRPRALARQRHHGGERFTEWCRRAPRQAQEQPLVQQEVEQHRQPAAFAEVLTQLLLFDVRLREQNGVALVPACRRGQLVEPLVFAAKLALVGMDVFDHERRGIETKPGHPQLQPEGDDLAHLVTDVGVVPVEIRLEVEEAMVVPGVGVLVIRPRRLLLVWEHDTLVDAHRLGP